MSRIKDGNYVKEFNFGVFDSEVNRYLNTLYLNSMALYMKAYGRNGTGTFEIDIKKIEDSIGYVEDYLYYFYRVTPDDFESVFHNLKKSNRNEKNKLDCITVFAPKDRGVYGKYSRNNNLLYINPQLGNSNDLSGDERTRLYICHELGHIQHGMWLNEAEKIFNVTKLPDEEVQLMYDGLSLLDEAITQDRAENITYLFSGKKRPAKFQKRSPLFGTVDTNFDYYGEFQNPTIDFARTLRGIGKIDDDEYVMDEFGNRALKSNFATNIFEEYINDGQISNLMFMLVKLGIIKNASYATFGYGDRKYLVQSVTALNDFNSVVDKMRDYRDPIVRK